MDDFFELLYNLASGNIKRIEAIGPDTVGNYIIDTCNTSDHGWETAVRKNEGEWVIVARYADKECAEKGHKIWTAMCAANPTKVWSVQLDEYVKF